MLPKLIKLLSALLIVFVVLQITINLIYCKRCGNSPGRVMSGMGGMYGSPLRFCLKHGHAWTFGFGSRATLHDWEFQQDSYRSEQAYHSAINWRATNATQ